MLGYVTIEKGELKVSEFEKYNGYYCGICKSIGKRLGQIPRLALSYDSVFLAVLKGALTDEKEILSHEHCIVHHIDKKPIVRDSSAVDYAADMMVILAYHKFLDDWKDERNAVSFAGKSSFFSAYKKVKKLYPQTCKAIEEALNKLSELEKEKSPSIDKTCDAFADVMEVLFEGISKEEETRRVLAVLGRNLGKWIYLVDAVDDLEKDKSGTSYNPLKYRFPESDNKTIGDGVSILIYHYLAQIADAYDLLPVRKNKGIIENIIFIGLRKQTENVLKKGTGKNEREPI